MPRMTPAEANEIHLSRNPVRRIKEIREYAGQIVGIGKSDRLPFLYSRRQLVQYAELGELMTSRESLELGTDILITQITEDLKSLELHIREFKEGEE